MEIAYKYDPELKRIVLTSETTIEGQVLPIQKYLTINPNRQQVIHQTGWVLSDQHTKLFSNNLEMWKCLRKLEDDLYEEESNLLLSVDSNIQPLIALHYTPLTQESLKSVCSDENIRSAVINILNITKQIHTACIQYFEDDSKFNVTFSWLMDGQKYLGFNTNTDEKGNFEKINPVKSQTFDIDAEEIQKNPEKYYDWLCSNLEGENEQAHKGACYWLVDNMHELFMLRSENRIFLN